jgi:hypothetical protein
MELLERLAVDRHDGGARGAELLRVHIERLVVDDARRDGRGHVDRQHLAHLFDALVLLFGRRDELHELIVLRTVELEIRDGVRDEDQDSDLGRRRTRHHDLGRRLRRRRVEAQPAVRRAARQDRREEEPVKAHRACRIHDWGYASHVHGTRASRGAISRCARHVFRALQLRHASWIGTPHD